MSTVTLSTAEVAERLGCTSRNVLSLIRNRSIRTMRIGPRGWRKIPIDELKKLRRVAVG